MFTQIFIGSLIVALNVIIQSFFIATAGRRIELLENKLNPPHLTLKIASVIALAMLWIVFGVSINCWIWTFVYLHHEVFNQVEPALYFSMVSFTTLGFGDIILDESSRLLSGFTAVSGLISFGLTSAFVVDMLGQFRRLRDEHPLVQKKMFF
jgi:hypothetical protein